jgi:PAS domain S-box-containing protein
MAKIREGNSVLDPKLKPKKVTKMNNAYLKVAGNKNNVNVTLSRKDDFFQLIAENVSDIILHAVFTPDFHYDYVSPSCTHITGYTPEEFYADAYLPKKITVPEDYPLVDPSTLNTRGENKPFDLRWIHKDGHIIWTEHLVTQTLDEYGKPVSFIVIARDITERKQTEAALKESQKFTGSLLENAPHATVVLNADTSVKYVNPAWERINGWTLAEVVGKKAPDYPWWPDEHKESFMEPFMATMKGGGGNSEIFAQKKNGEIYWIEMNWVSVKNNDELVYMIINSVDITDRKKMEAALKESEEKFSKAFSSSPNPVCIVTVKEDTFLEVNESFLDFSGYTKEEVIGHTPAELNLWVSKDDEEKIGKGLKETGKVERLEIQSRMKSGEIKTGLFSAEEIEIGGIKCVTLVITDVTESKKAQEALRESEEKFSKAFQASPSSISISKMSDGKFIEVNDTFLRDKGYMREEVIGHTAAELKIYANKDDYTVIRDTLTKQGKFVNRETRYLTKTGQKRIGLMSAEIIKIGDEPCMIVIHTDITAQKDVETKLQAHQKLIDNILANTPQGVLVIDKDHRVLLANKALQKIFNLDSRTLKNKLLKEIFPADHFFNLHKAVESASEEKQSVEFRYLIKEQEKIIHSIVVKMDGERIILTFSDISREREEEEKLYLTDRLASLGQMAAGLAHELNNPLTGILALSQMLKNDNLPAEHKEDIACIHNEAKRAAEIVKNVLLFARNKPGENGRSSPNEVIKDILKLREYEERINNINVVTNLDENLPEIPVEKGQLQQVFLNMISNAEAAIEDIKNSGTITITTQRVNSHVNLIISDDGCGIKKQILPRIFDPFFTTKDIGKGTGLGLSICYSIIVKHGGKVSVKSVVNEGTTFTIRMPAVSGN